METEPLAIVPPDANKDISKFSHNEDATPDEQSIMMADHQRNLVYQFCRDYAHDNGYDFQEDVGAATPDDYQDVTGEKMFMTTDELAEMESVIYSISFGKQSKEKRISYQAFSAAISQ